MPHIITLSNQMVLKVHCCPIILLITFHQIKQPLKFALTLVRALSAFASAPVPRVSALFTTLMSVLTLFDWVGLPVCVTSFHFCVVLKKSESAFFQYSKLANLLIGRSSLPGSSILYALKHIHL
mmetsp:Transcript_21768/g.44602  ORF Transcript_21768/g.44602 Transcript_21768/m.44602 type:complete len:124 (+) Transcript_21768:1918-2289(+)